MGYSLNGVWHGTQSWTRSKDGAFVRDESSFRARLSGDAASVHPVEPKRYHLYISRACPWAHRVMLVRALFGLESFLPLSFVDPIMHDKGWEFSTDHEDNLFGYETLHQVYVAAKSDYTGRVTVPILFDRKAGKVVNNESSEIIRMLNDVAPRTKRNELDLYPRALQLEIDAWNDRIYSSLNNGVYRCGFATTQSAYQAAVSALFDCLDALEVHLQTRSHLVGEQLTEADLRLFPTLIRFDAVYHGHFKCNLRKLSEYPAIYDYLKRIYALEEIAATCDLDEIKTHYYGSHLTINPTGIIPKGPAIWP
jgi:glutathionyl-hydroquinone reductase